MRTNSRKETALTLVFAFMMPILLALPAFAAVGIYPFGDKSMLIVDMHSEYIDYLAEMNNSLRHSGSFLRSWSMGMGLNMLGLIAFYTASPFNAIVLLLPLSVITEAVFAVTMLKLGAAGLFFVLFAREIFPQAGRSLHVAFGVAYALNGYNIAYSSNLMWLDGAAFLPLVLLGVERILRGGRYRLFLFSLIYVFFTSYYIGYMIGIFAFLYFTASGIAKAASPWQSGIRAYARMLPRFLGSAALAAGCCAFLLLPAFLGLKDGQSEMWTQTFSLRLRYPVVRLAAKLLPGVYDSLTDSGLPNVYCTVFGVMLCVLYFCTKAVPRREKFAFGGLLAFLIFSFSCELFDIAWHAFEVPTWYPARYSFVFSFFILFLALRCACVLESVSRRAIFAAMLVLLLLFAEIAVNRFRFATWQSIAAGMALVLLYALAFMMNKPLFGHQKTLAAESNGRVVRSFKLPAAFRMNKLTFGHRKTLAAESNGRVVRSFKLLWRAGSGTSSRIRINSRALSAMMLVIVCMEAFGAAASTVSGMDAQFGYRSRSEYLNFMQSYGDAVDLMKSIDDGVYRSELIGARNANGSMALGYNGISHYSTTTNQKLNQFLRDLGYNKGTENELRFSASTPVTNGLLGIKYVLSKNDMGGAYRLREKVGEVGIYENNLAFPLAFWAPSEAAAYTADTQNPFALQNGLISALTGERADIFTPLGLLERRLGNAEQSLADGHISYSRQIRSRETSVEFIAVNPRRSEAYAFFPVYDNLFSGAEVFVNGVSAGRDLMYRANTVISLGDAYRPAVALVPRTDTIRLAAEHFAALDFEAAQKAAETAAQNQMQFTLFRDTAVEGVVTAPEDGLLATTFPFDSGWTVKVDGRRVEPVKLAEVFLAVPLTAGEHVITMRYLPAGFAAGLVITAASICGMLIFFWRGKRRDIANENQA